MSEFEPTWFTHGQQAIEQAIKRATALAEAPGTAVPLPDVLPNRGLGTEGALERLAPHVLDGARRLGDAAAFAHMDPPTAAAAQATTWWNAVLNQNLLHPDTAPAARDAEKRAVGWLAPFFGMDGGHMLPGSTLGNLTALWAARELRGVRRVVASEAAHLSVGKAAHLLGLAHETVPVDGGGALDAALLSDLSDACLVLTAGTTSMGAVDPLEPQGAAWTHVDAAWAGPMRLSPRFAARLAGIEGADSVAVSAHKWLFQPKESALVLFADSAAAHETISFGGAYLAVPNVGLLGSHGAIAVPLLATLLAPGRDGVAATVEHAMDAMDRFADGLARTEGVTLYGSNRTGVLAWRLSNDAATSALHARLPEGSTSLTRLDHRVWCRNVAANPMADVDALLEAVRKAMHENV